MLLFQDSPAQDSSTMISRSAGNGAVGLLRWKLLNWVGIGFLALGVLSVGATVVATGALESLIAAIMVFWGSLGAMMCIAFTHSKERVFSAAAFGCLALIGVVFLIYPFVAAEALTMVALLALLFEGVSMILFALGLSADVREWLWIAGSGAISVVASAVLLAGWPATGDWLLGSLLGVNFLSTGAALISVARPIRRKAL